MARFRGVWTWLVSLVPVGRTRLKSRASSGEVKEWHAVCFCSCKAASALAGCERVWMRKVQYAYS